MAADLLAQRAALQAQLAAVDAQIDADGGIVIKKDGRAICMRADCPNREGRRKMAGIPLGRLHVALTGLDNPTLTAVVTALTAPFHQTTGWTRLLNPHVRCCVPPITPIVRMRDKVNCAICLTAMLSKTDALKNVSDHVVACSKCAVPGGGAGFGTTSLYMALSPLVHLFTYTLADCSVSFVLGGSYEDSQVPVDANRRWTADAGFTFTITVGNRTFVYHVFFEVDGTGHSAPGEIASDTMAVLNAAFSMGRLTKYVLFNFFNSRTRRMLFPYMS